MCGIAFAIGPKPVGEFIYSACEKQRHRGPDSNGTYFEQTSSFFLGIGHQRLAILDRSTRGHQPMASRSGRMIIAFNGEIYNHRELAEELGLQHLTSGTDTEVAVEAIEILGVEEACKRFNGMWAIVVYDRRSGTIYLCRDRFGKKPLHYTFIDGTLYVASEMKTLLECGKNGRRINKEVAARYLMQGLTALDEQTWIAGISSFPAACVGQIRVSHYSSGIGCIARYWSLDPSPKQTVGAEEYIEQLHDLVSEAVRCRLQADVGIGVALSGGVDSSIISVLAHHAVGDNARLFSAIHPGEEEDESSYVSMVSEHLGAKVNSVSLANKTGEDLASLLSAGNVANDGPVTSFSSLLFYELMQSAKSKGITVVLSGQGADEAFCGHLKYPAFEFQRLLSSNPLRAIAFAIPFISNGTFLPSFKIAEAKRFWGRTNIGLLGATARATANVEPLWHRMKTSSERQIADIERYTVPFLTHYEDRMAMAASVEVRCPFLDHRVVQLGVQAPTELKMQLGWTKYCLRKAFEGQLPNQVLFSKHKRGFVNPEASWMKTLLKDRVVDLLNDPDAPIFNLGLVDRLAYSQKFEAFCAGSSHVWVRDVFGPFSLNNWLSLNSSHLTA